LPEEEKRPYAAKLDEGSYRGYKLRGIWSNDVVKDNIEVGPTCRDIALAQLDDVLASLQHYNLETPSFHPPSSQHHPGVLPFLPEIERYVVSLLSLFLVLPLTMCPPTRFADHTYNHIVRKILALVSLVLELDEDALWRLHGHEAPIGNACQRFMGYWPRCEFS
jgi:hypothetical protein